MRKRLALLAVMVASLATVGAPAPMDVMELTEAEAHTAYCGHGIKWAVYGVSYDRFDGHVRVYVHVYSSWKSLPDGVHWLIVHSHVRFCH